MREETRHQVQAAGLVARNASRGLDEQAGAPQLKPARGGKADEGVAHDEDVLAAPFDEDKERTRALVERMRALGEDAELDPFDDALADDRDALQLGGGVIGGVCRAGRGAEDQPFDALADAALMRARAHERHEPTLCPSGAIQQRLERRVDCVQGWLRPRVQADSVFSIMSTKKPIVLIADDDPEILTLLGIRLSKKGYHVVEAPDGNTALDKARKERPDLVLLDVMMPGKNGWEVAKALRDDPELSGVGILMLTAIGERVNEMTSPLYGADDFVDKPFDFAALEQKIGEVLKKRGR